jgi:hypothetical protein
MSETKETSTVNRAQRFKVEFTSDYFNVQRTSVVNLIHFFQTRADKPEVKLKFYFKPYNTDKFIQRNIEMLTLNFEPVEWKSVFIARLNLLANRLSKFDIVGIEKSKLPLDEKSQLDIIKSLLCSVCYRVDQEARDEFNFFFGISDKKFWDFATIEKPIWTGPIDKLHKYQDAHHYFKNLMSSRGNGEQMLQIPDQISSINTLNIRQNSNGCPAEIKSDTHSGPHPRPPEVTFANFDGKPVYDVKVNYVGLKQLDNLRGICETSLRGKNSLVKPSFFEIPPSSPIEGLRRFVTFTIPVEVGDIISLPQIFRKKSQIVTSCKKVKAGRSSLRAVNDENGHPNKRIKTN